MKLRISLLVIILLVLITPSVFAQDASQAGTDAANQSLGKYGNITGLTDNVFKPIQGQVDMQTVDGSKSFNGQVTCSAASTFMEISTVTGITDDITTVNVAWDDNLDGTMDSLIELTSLTEYGHISGVCTNGFISCEPGTWNNCRGYRADYGTGAFVMFLTSVSNLESCYCVNQDCQNPSLQDKDKMETISGAMLKAFQKTYTDLTVSEQFFSNTSSYYKGQLPTSCFPSSTVSTLSGHFSNPFAIETDAMSEMLNQSSDPNSLYSMTSNAYANQMQPHNTVSCNITRAVSQNVLDLYDIIEPTGGSGSLAVINTCGSFCLDIAIGQPNNNWLCGSCGIWEGSYNFFIHAPEKIIDATLMDVYYDDHMQIWIGNLSGVSTTGYCGPAAECVWSGPHDAFPPETPEGCCEHETSFHDIPNLDLTGYFANYGALQTKVRIAYSGCGEGYAHIRVNVTDFCTITETFTDNCDVYEVDPNCQLKDETIDGIQTISEFNITGDYPDPSPVTVCGQNEMRDWYVKERTYMCSQTGAFDFTNAKQRMAAINSGTSRTGNTFVYGDYYKLESGTWTNFTSNTQTMQAPPSVPLCVEVCRVKVTASDTYASTTGNTANYNLSTEMDEFRYKNCDNGTCPVSAAETLVDGCSCQTNFNEAFSAMQLLRLAGEDIECAPY